MLQKQLNQSSKRKEWTNEQMLAALDDVKKGVSANCAADANGIPLKNRRVVHGTNPKPRPYLTKDDVSVLGYRSRYWSRVAAM